MADYDLKSNQLMKIHAFNNAMDADTNGTGVDALDYGSVTFGIYVGIGGITFDASNKIEFFVEESADNSTWNVAADDALILDAGATAPGDTGKVRSLTAAKAAADTTMTTVGYRGKKRYARVRSEFTGTHGTGTPIVIVSQVGHPYHKPVGQTNISESAIAAQ